MICLDTNYLIRAIAKGTREAREVVNWLEAGEVLITPMPAWFEFICGPVNENQIRVVRELLTQIAPFAEAEAAEAARLFNAIGRKRSFRVDAMIAGTAMATSARLATQNRSHFRRFVEHGLLLV